MPIPTVLSFAAAFFSLTMAVTVLFRDRHSLHHRVFATGMFLLAAEEIFRAFSSAAILPADVLYWHTRLFIVSALVPAAWLVFSVSYARASTSILQSRWKWGLAAVCLVPFYLSLCFEVRFLQALPHWDRRDGYSRLDGPVRSSSITSW